MTLSIAYIQFSLNVTGWVHYLRLNRESVPPDHIGTIEEILLQWTGNIVQFVTVFAVESLRRYEGNLD